MKRVHRSLAAAVVILPCCLGPGCSTYRTHAPGYVGTADGRDTVWSLGWGLVHQLPEVDNCNGQPLAEVTVRSNLAFDLLSVVTLGLASPKIVEWKCANPVPAEGEIPTPGAPAGPLPQP